MSGTKPTAGGDLGGITVLIVDNDPTARTVAGAVLRGAKCEDVVQTADGQRAIDIVSSRTIHLVLMDSRMPEPAGMAFLHRLRSVPGGRSVPVIIMTSSDNVEDACQARQAGVLAWLMKPLQPASLLAHTLAALKRAHPRLEEPSTLNTLADSYEGRLAIGLQDLAQNAMRVQTGHRTFAACADEILRQLHGVRATAELLGYSLVEEVCSIMHDLHRSILTNAIIPEPMQIELMRLIRIGASSMAMMAEKKLRGSGGPAGPLILDQLRPPLLEMQARIDELVAAAEAKNKSEMDAMAIRRAEVETEAWRLRRTVTIDSKVPMAR
jgi:two-component system chemotaxis response regulator CheY